MDVVVHEAVANHRNLMSVAESSDCFQVDGAVGVRMKDLPAVIAPLRDVMGTVRDHNS